MKEIIILMGAMGSGKGTQAAMLRDVRECNYIETGAIFRGLDRSNPVDAKIKDIMESGALVPDAETCELVETRLTADSDMLFDGFPRNIPQAEWLMNWAREHDMHVNVVHFNVPKEVAIERAAKRVAQGAGRKDDVDPVAIEKRLNEYYTKAVPTLDWFKSQPDVNFIEIDARQTEAEIFAEMTAGLE